MRRTLALLMALSLVWASGCGAPADESAWTEYAGPLLERAEAVEAELDRADLDVERGKSLILETRGSLAGYEPADEHGAEFEQLVRDAMDDYSEGLKAYDAKLPGVGRQWFDQADGKVEQARQLLERYTQE